MTTDLESRIRASLRERADDVEPTPHLWRTVERRTRQRRTLPVLVWAAAGTAAAVTAVAVLPAVLDDGGPRLTIDPADRPAITQEGTTGGQAVVTRSPSHYVAVSGRQLLLRSVDDGSATVLAELAPEGESRPRTLAVRPGSSPDDLTVAYVTEAEGMFDLRLLRAVDGTVSTSVVAGDLSPTVSSQDTVAPTPAWSPDGRTMAWVAPDGDGAPALYLMDLEEHLEEASRTGAGTGAVRHAPTEVRLSADEAVLDARRLRLQDWRTDDGRGRLSLTQDGQLLRSTIAPQADGRWDVDTLVPAAVEGYVVDVAAGEGDEEYVLTAGGSTAKDAEDAGLQLRIGAQAVGIDLPTAAPADVWMTAVPGGAIVGLGGDARLVTRAEDGIVVGLAPAGTDHAAFVPRSGEAQQVGPPAEDGAAGEALATHLTTDDAGRLVLRTGDGDRVLYPEAATSVEAAKVVEDVSVRPGSSPDALTAVLLVASESGPELVAVTLGDGTVRSTPMTGPHGIGPDADLRTLQAPIWAPDGDHLAWVERGADGGWRLRTVGWDGGPGTGRPADDNATFGVELSTSDLLAAEWIAGEDGEGERRSLLFLVSRTEAADGGERGLYRLEIGHQGDGALSLARPPVAVPPDDPGHGQVLGVQLGEANGTRLVRTDDGRTAVVFGADGDLIHLPELDHVEAPRLRLSGTPGEPIVVGGPEALLVRADGTVLRLGAANDVELVE